jgi:acetyltransferase-like isoleucine patch superfamily enzyme
MFVKILSFFLPWALRRRLLNRWFGFRIHPSARIGLSWIFPKKLVMEPGARIGHFNVAIHLDKIEMKAGATIGRGNWITGFPIGTGSKHFCHQTDRKPELFMGECAAITKKHHIDCTHFIYIGKYATLAGYYSQLLTHSIDVFENRQDSLPIYIGDFTFVGTNVVVLGGAVLPSYSVLGAKSLLNKTYENEWTLYGGVPAQPITEIRREAKYFRRENGFVH